MKKKRMNAVLAIASLGLMTASATCVTAYQAFGAEPVAVYAEGAEEDGTEQTTTEPSKVDEAKEWFSKFFSPDKVAMYLSWVAYIGTIIGLVANIKKLKQSNNLTLKNVSDEVQAKIKEAVGDEVAEQFGKIAPKLISGQEQANEIMSIFAKILALSQENTAESRVAILNLIEQLGVVGKELTETAKEAVEEAEALAEKAKEEADKKLDEIVDGYDGTSI